MRKRIEPTGPVSGFTQLNAPSTLRITSSDTSSGKARKMSVMRIMMSSKRPPLIPATAPMSDPMATLSSEAMNPRNSDTRMP